MLTAEDAILQLLQERGPEKSICPSEAARRLDAEDFRLQMEKVRKAGRRLHDRGMIEVTRKGKIVDPHTVKGVIRYRLKSDDISSLDDDMA